MECLDNLIVVKSLCNPRDRDNSKRYIDELPGIDLSVISNWANLSTDETTEDVVQSKINLSTREALYEVMYELNTKKQLTVNTLLCTQTFGKFLANNLSDPTKIKRGAIIKHRKYKESKMARIKIDSIRLFSENSGNLGIFIQDGPIFQTFQKDVIAGINDFFLDYKAQYDDVQIYIQDDKLILSSLSIHDNYDYQCQKCIPNGCLDIIPINDNVFEITASVHCSIDNLICNMKDQLIDVLLYYTAKEIVKEGLFSSRLNADTLNQDKNEKLLKSFEDSYQKKLSAITESLYQYLKHFDNYCIKCKGAKHRHFKAGGYDNLDGSLYQRNV